MAARGDGGAGDAGAERIGAGARFRKLTGSGNDFVAFDQLYLLDEARPELLPTAAQVRALCHRRLGVGADGVMVLRGSASADWRLVYYNADGSRAELCGNASLCSVWLGALLGRGGDVTFHTDAGPVRGRLRGDLPEIDLAPVGEVEADRRDLRAGPLRPDERRLGFARVGVPHVVVLCADAGAVELAERGPALRHHAALADGANVNYVSRAGERWAIRTFERGVEAETLACGTGSVATAVLLAAWREVEPDADAPVELVMSTGLEHRVTLRRSAERAWQPSLAGAARVVFDGVLGDGDWTR